MIAKCDITEYAQVEALLYSLLTTKSINIPHQLLEKLSSCQINPEDLWILAQIVPLSRENARLVEDVIEVSKR